MSALKLVRIGDAEAGITASMRAGLEEILRVGCVLREERLDPEFAFHPERGQYHSTEILGRLKERCGEGAWRVLGLAEVDLYIPILTYVFGEAEVGGRCAVISTHRLRQEFYGLPPDGKLLEKRALKEAVHELGHTLGLMHCENYECVMAASHAVEWIDIKGSEFCRACRELTVRAGAAR